MNKILFFLYVGIVGTCAQTVSMSGDVTGSNAATVVVKINGVPPGALATVTPGTGVAAALANAVNGANGVIQLTAAGKYPALDGTLITGIAALASANAFVNSQTITSASGTGVPLTINGFSSSQTGDLLDINLNSGGASRFTVDHSGNVTLAGSLTGTIQIKTDTDANFYTPGSAPADSLLQGQLGLGTTLGILYSNYSGTAGDNRPIAVFASNILQPPSTTGTTGANVGVIAGNTTNSAGTGGTLLLTGGGATTTSGTVHGGAITMQGGSATVTTGTANGSLVSILGGGIAATGGSGGNTGGNVNIDAGLYNVTGGALTNSFPGGVTIGDSNAGYVDLGWIGSSTPASTAVPNLVIAAGTNVGSASLPNSSGGWCGQLQFSFTGAISAGATLVTLTGPAASQVGTQWDLILTPANAAAATLVTTYGVFTVGSSTGATFHINLTDAVGSGGPYQFNYIMVNH